MAERTTIAWFILLVGLTASFFFFIAKQDDYAYIVVFVGFYATITVLYFLRMFYYVQYKATLNEIYFFSLGNINPLVVLLISPYVPMYKQNILAFTISSTKTSLLQTPLMLHINILSILAFPYLALSTALLIRSFTRYQFIRLTAHSEKGPSAEWTAILTFFIFGILFAFVGISVQDLIGFTYGVFFLLSGVGFLFGR